MHSIISRSASPIISNDMLHLEKLADSSGESSCFSLEETGHDLSADLEVQEVENLMLPYCIW